MKSFALACLVAASTTAINLPAESTVETVDAEIIEIVVEQVLSGFDAIAEENYAAEETEVVEIVEQKVYAGE